MQQQGRGGQGRGGKKGRGRGRGQQKFQKGLLDAVAPKAAIVSQRQPPKRGSPPPGMPAAGAGRGLGGGHITDALAQGVAAQDASPFAELFADRQGEVARLGQELQLGGDPKAAMEAALADDAHRKLAHVIGGLVQAQADLQKAAYSACATGVEQALKSLSQYMGDINPDNCSAPGWFVPMLGPCITLCTRLAFAAERGESKRDEYVKKVVEQLVVCVRKVNDKNPPEQSKRMGLIVLCNHLSKLAFAINNMGALTSALNNMVKTDQDVLKQHGMSLVESASKAQRCTYFFYTGRRAMLDQKFTMAEENLSKAFALCHTGYRKNQIRILVFLLAVKLVKGKFPAPGLLEEFGLDSIFQPLVTAIKNGQVYAFDRCMERNASFFAKLGIYVMLHRARSVCYFTALRRVHHVKEQIVDDDGPSRIDLNMFVEAMKIMNGGEEVELDDVECALICLMSHKQVAGYISREHKKIVLKKGDPFTSE